MPYSTGLVLLLLALGAMLVPGCGDAEDAFCANMQDGTPCTFKETGRKDAFGVVVGCGDDQFSHSADE